MKKKYMKIIKHLKITIKSTKNWSIIGKDTLIKKFKQLSNLLLLN